MRRLAASRRAFFARGEITARVTRVKAGKNAEARRTYVVPARSWLCCARTLQIKRFVAGRGKQFRAFAVVRETYRGAGRCKNRQTSSRRLSATWGETGAGGLQTRFKAAYANGTRSRGLNAFCLLFYASCKFPVFSRSCRRNGRAACGAITGGIMSDFDLSIIINYSVFIIASYHCYYLHNGRNAAAISLLYRVPS